MTTDHGPQRESIRDLMGRHGLDPNRMQSERDFIDMMQPYAEDLMTTDHGPQRQPASDPYNSPEWRAKFRADCNKIAIEAKQEHDELARLRAENERLKRLDLTADEFQKLLDSPAYCRAFAEYARKLFGADKSAEAIAACAMQKQWARDLNRVRAVLEQFANSDNWVKDAMEDDWYWDGEGEPWQLAADALRGEE